MKCHAALRTAHSRFVCQLRFMDQSAALPRAPVKVWMLCVLGRLAGESWHRQVIRSLLIALDPRGHGPRHRDVAHKLARKIRR